MESANRLSSDGPVEEQAREQAGQRQVRLRIDQRNMASAYANAFRTHGSAEEVILDFGVNLVNPAAGPGGPGGTNGPQPEVVFQIASRVIMNYYSAKRLALTLGQLIRRHEEQFGELELDVVRRRKDA